MQDAAAEKGNDEEESKPADEVAKPGDDVTVRKELVHPEQVVQDL